MARRRRSFFSQFRSISRNIKTIFSSLVGLGVIGTIGYFSWPGSGLWSNNEDENAPGESIVVELSPKSSSQIKIGTFNIENFGTSQLEKPEVMATLADIAMSFDVLAVQEISAKNGNALNDLVTKMNEADEDRFDYLVSPLLGKDPSKKGSDTEQFGFIYDTKRIELADKEHLGFVVSAKKFGKMFNRLPVVSSFKVSSSLSSNPFSFSLVTFHNVPDKERKRWEEETANIRFVLEDVRKVLATEDDIILLGDFNASADKIQSSLSSLKEEFVTAITLEKTNVKQTKSYDNLVFAKKATTEFIEGKVFDFSEVCKKYDAQLDDVSDHFPVVATFGIEENKKIERIASKKQ